MKTTLSMKGIGILVLALMVLSVPVSFAADYDAESVLQAYRDSYNWLNSATMKVNSARQMLDRPVLTRDEAIKMRMENDHAYSWKQTRNVSEATFHSNGRDRWQYDATQSSIDLYTGKILVTEDGKDIRRIQQLVSPELGFYCFQYSVPNYPDKWIDLYNIDDFSRGSRAMWHSELQPVLGYFRDYRETRIPDTLSVKNMTVREEIQGTKSICVVEAVVPEGNITLWLDPDLGFALQRSITVYNYKRDHMPVDESLPPLPERPYTVAFVTQTTVTKREMIDGQSIPVEFDVLSYRQYEDSKEDRSESKVVLSDVKLNPDFKALHAFALTIPHGADVDYTYPRDPDSNTVRSISSTWEGDKIVFDSDDQEMVAKLDKFVAGATIEKGFLPGKMRMKLAKLRYKIAKTSFLTWYYMKNSMTLDWSTLLLSLMAIGGCFFVAGRIIYRKGAASRDKERPTAA